MSDTDYTTIETPYTENTLTRSSTSADGLLTIGEVSDDSTTSTDTISTTTSKTVTATIDSAVVAKSNNSLNDLWITNFIKSVNWKPKKVGFYIDGQSGYAEFSNVFVSGNIQALTGTIGGFTIGATDLSVTRGGYQTIISSDSTAFSAGPTGAPTVTISQAGLLTAQAGIIGGFTITSTSLYGGIIKTAATVEAGTSGVVMDTGGLRGYDSVLGQTFNLPTNGSAPTFASGVINYSTFNVNTNAVIRTSATVGDGTANSAGILINSTGFYACETNQTLANANVKILIDGSAVYRGQVEIGTTGGAEVVIAGNDIHLYDDSQGGYKITHFTDYSGTIPGKIQITTSIENRLYVGLTIIITGTTNYNGTYTIGGIIDSYNFYVTSSYVADDATGLINGVGSIIGDTAAVNFYRADGLTGNFEMQKRAGYDNNLSNAMEMFYNAAAQDDGENLLYIGREGVYTNPNYTDGIVFTAKEAVYIEMGNLYRFYERLPFVIGDLSTATIPGEGIVSRISGEGKDGYSGLGFMVEILTFTGATAFSVGDKITGDSSGATFFITKKISTSQFWGDHTNSYTFTSSDTTCTTDGGGGGTGTGSFSSSSMGTFVPIKADHSLTIKIDSSILPTNDNWYDIGSSSYAIRNIYSNNIYSSTLYSETIGTTNSTSTDRIMIVKDSSYNSSPSIDAYDGSLCVGGLRPMINTTGKGWFLEAYNPSSSTTVDAQIQVSTTGTIKEIYFYLNDGGDSIGIYTEDGGTTNWISFNNFYVDGSFSPGLGTGTTNGNLGSSTREWDKLYINEVRYTTLTDVSDLRLKQNIKDFDLGLKELNQLRPVSFEWKQDGRKTKGFIAQEVQEIIPDMIIHENDDENEIKDLLTINMNYMFPLLVKSIQELSKKVEELEKKLNI